MRRSEMTAANLSVVKETIDMLLVRSLRFKVAHGKGAHGKGEEITAVGWEDLMSRGEEKLRSLSKDNSDKLLRLAQLFSMPGKPLVCAARPEITARVTGGKREK